LFSKRHSSIQIIPDSIPSVATKTETKNKHICKYNDNQSLDNGADYDRRCNRKLRKIA
jgi:hypothetical protein